MNIKKANRRGSLTVYRRVRTRKAHGWDHDRVIVPKELLPHWGLLCRGVQKSMFVSVSVSLSVRNEIGTGTTFWNNCEGILTPPGLDGKMSAFR